LAIYQDIQEKVYQEIISVFGDNEITDDDITYENLGQLKYLEMVLKETLRVFTPVPISARETIEKVDLGLNAPLSKGTKIFLFNYVLHRRKDIWGENADNFDPENFSPENSSKRDPYSYVPFGAG
jgi:cytochrome P450